jgi:hypothetical protein
MPRTTNAAGRIRDESLMNLGGHGFQGHPIQFPLVYLYKSLLRVGQTRIFDNCF